MTSRHDLAVHSSNDCDIHSSVMDWDGVELTLIYLSDSDFPVQAVREDYDYAPDGSSWTWVPLEFGPTRA